MLYYNEQKEYFKMQSVLIQIKLCYWRDMHRGKEKGISMIVCGIKDCWMGPESMFTEEPAAEIKVMVREAFGDSH